MKFSQAKKNQKGMGLIEIMITLAIVGILVSFIFSIAMGVMDRGRAANDAKAFLTLTADIQTFLGPAGLPGVSDTIVAGLAPPNMVVAGATPTFVNSHGGGLTVGFTTPRMIFTSIGYSEEGCIKLVEMMSTSAAIISATDAGDDIGTGNIKEATDRTHDPEDTLTNCNGGARTLHIGL